MPCEQCQGIEAIFNPAQAERELRRYRERGPAGRTRQLIEQLRLADVAGATLMDIGGGVGAIALELLRAGAAHARAVDASGAYLAAAREEAQRQQLAERMEFQHGNFVELAEQLPAADIVTLDRVICCYPDMPGLVGLSAARARRLYGLIYPRDLLWIRLFAALFNFWLRLFRQRFQFFVHRSARVDAAIRAQGLRPRYQRKGLFWQLAVYERGEEPSANG